MYEAKKLNELTVLILLHEVNFVYNILIDIGVNSRYLNGDNLFDTYIVRVHVCLIRMCARL